eukprot:31548_1
MKVDSAMDEQDADADVTAEMERNTCAGRSDDLALDAAEAKDVNAAEDEHDNKSQPDSNVTEPASTTDTATGTAINTTSTTSIKRETSTSGSSIGRKRVRS